MTLCYIWNQRVFWPLGKQSQAMVSEWMVEYLGMHSGAVSGLWRVTASATAAAMELTLSMEPVPVAWARGARGPGPPEEPLTLRNKELRMKEVELLQDRII